jgi:hypothetical protein
MVWLKVEDGIEEHPAGQSHGNSDFCNLVVAQNGGF